MELLPNAAEKLTCLCGTSDPLIPLSHQEVIKEALKSEIPDGKRFKYVEIKGADHGFMCEQRHNFNKEASELGWQLLLAEVNP